VVPPPGCRSIAPQLILRRWSSDIGTQRGHLLSGDHLRRTLTRYFSQVKRRSDFVERRRRLEEFNRNLRGFGVPESGMAPTGEPAAGDPGSESRRRAIDQLVTDWFAPKRIVAEDLARRYQRRFRRLDTGVYILTVVAVTLGAMSLLLDSWVPVAVESVVLVVLLGVTVFNVRRTDHDRWIAFRTIAEYLRSSQSMCLVVPRPVTGATRTRSTEHPMMRSRIVPWFAPVLDDIWDGRPELPVTGADVDWLRDRLATDWVTEQQQWHARRSRKHDRWNWYYRSAIGAVFGLSVTLVVVHAVRSIGFWVTHEHHYHLEFPDGVVAIVVIGLASTGAALNGLSSHANHLGHAERFSDVAYELEQVHKELRTAATMDELRRCAVAVRHIMMGETDAWFVGMSSSEIEVPT
jgi:hypothetical protein